MGADGRRDVCLVQPGDVKVFIDRRNIDFHRAGLAVAAINAVAPEIVPQGTQNGGVVPLFLARFQVADRLAHLRAAFTAEHNGGDRRAAQSVYSDMQLIAESYDLMRRGLGMTPAEIGDVFEEWNKTELDSYLIEITAEVLHQVDKKTGKPLVDLIVDHAGMKGTGTWTVQTALSLAVPVTGIAEAVFARGLSSEADLREEAQKQGFAGPDGKLNLNDDEKKAFIEDIRQALYASKIVAYAQGFNEITTAAKEYGWDIDLAAVARIWRGGCIIRAKFLNRISEAFESGEANVSLLFAPYFKNAIENAEKSWRNVVAQAAINGLPTPAFASSLSYFDGLRSKRLPAALIQGQRDYFGAHTYQRVDQPGAFHTLWAEPGREEIEA